ncbi:M16 family metallopeptidase [Flavihumibacter sp.]|uniref:M16 family metallopeptidase n=1 Tax=Flavihumibacter sp. TaxID=1913981 RepID=UPI002FC60E2A
MPFSSMVLIMTLLLCINSIPSLYAQTLEPLGFEYFKLDNGLKVVLLKTDSPSPVTVNLSYNIGFRLEQRGEAGFAHLAEHVWMASNKIRKGIVNASTRYDHTSFYAVLPPDRLRKYLKQEALRMRNSTVRQKILTSQKYALNDEHKLTVTNHPYGGFPWQRMPKIAFENWQNAHDYFGDPHLISNASVEDIQNFLNRYYIPNNAVLVVMGNFNSASTRSWIMKYFGSIGQKPLPQKPDISEPIQVKEKTAVITDGLIRRPALSVAYKIPERTSPYYFAMGLIDQMLVKGKDSRLYQLLVEQKKYTDRVNGGINYLGNMFTHNGPMLWMTHMVYDPSVHKDSLIATIEQAIGSIQREINDSMLEQAKWGVMESFKQMREERNGLAVSDMLACFALFDDDPAQYNYIESSFNKVDASMIRQTLTNWLKPSNRTVLVLSPKNPE